jgi:lipopolysaccharide/colanic/teichoic acid biosynthesis glycosyltransferase
MLDLAAGGAAAILLAPVIFLIALALWAEGGRPLLFVQIRLGSGGRPFCMYKFRKFRVDCDDDTPLTREGDQRMTRIGRILAAAKFDELPQLYNVLRGDMAIVGPRPESLAFADCFTGGFEKVLQYRPGLLGPSQVFFRHESRLYPPFEDPTLFYRDVLFAAKASLDLAYFPRRTIVSDLGWILRGALAVIGVAAKPPAILNETEFDGACDVPSAGARRWRREAH